MSNYIIKVKNPAGDEGTITSDGGFSYTNSLKEVNEGQLKITGTGEVKRGLLEIGSLVSIYRNGTLEFYGIINALTYLNAGGISADLKGYEVWLGKEKGDYSGSPWKSTPSATIASAIIGESTKLSAGTIEAGTDIDFKAEPSSSLWNVLLGLVTRTDQDIGIDYSDLTVDILNHKGSSTSVLTLNDGIQIQDLTFREAYPIANDVRVFGKGDGSNQIKSDFTSHGQDAGSKSSYGTIRKVYTDPSIVTADEANLLADKLVAKWKDPTKIYEFDVINPNQDLEVGDVITINSQTKGLTNEEIRIVSVERGVRNAQEFMTLQVTNKEYSLISKGINQYLAGIKKNSNDFETYSQGTTNILNFSDMINANNTAPLRVKAYFSENDIADEMGNLRINSFTLDYDVDPYRLGVGSANQDDVAPGVSGSSGSTAPGVSGSSGSTSPGVSGSSSSTQPGVSGESGSFYTYSDVGSDGYTTYSLSSGSWTTVARVYPGSSYLNQEILASIGIMGSSGGTEDIEIRVGNDAVYGYIEPGVTGSGATVWGTYCESFRDTSMIKVTSIPVGEVSSSSDSIFLAIRPQSGAIDLTCGLWLSTAKHSHSDGSYYANSHDHADGSYYANSHSHDDGSYSASSHSHADGSYSAASHNHNVSIGDGISDSGSLNASEVSIYLDHWDGSNWVNKYSILNTGKTIDYDVDISNGGTYPDAAGYWRVRIFTDSANPDLVQATIKCKHELDT